MTESDYPRRTGSWCYRITRERIDGEDHYTIREVYTGKDGALSWTEDAIAASGESWVECADTLSLMTRALGSDVLDLTLDPPALVPVIEHRRAMRSAAGKTPLCGLCDEPLAADDDTRPLGGVPSGKAHRECLLRSVVGGIGHHENHALWCTERGDPDGGRSYRQSALEVDALYASRA